MHQKKPIMKNHIPNFAIPTILSAAEFTGIAGITTGKVQTSSFKDNRNKCF